MDFVDTLLHQIYLSMIMDTEFIHLKIKSHIHEITGIHGCKPSVHQCQTLITIFLYIYKCNDNSYRENAYFKNLKSSCPLRSYAYRSVSEQQYRCCSVKSKSTRFTQLPPTSFRSRLKLKHIHWKIILIPSLVNFCWKKLRMH